jgi:phosphoglycolate phosphatase
MKRYDAVVFDLDGTLLDTLADIGNAANESLQRMGLPTHPLSDYGQFVGAGVASLFDSAIEEFQTGRIELIRQCVQLFDETYSRHWDRLSKPYPGILDLIDALSGEGVKQAILSNKPHEFTCLCVRQFFTEGTFIPVLGQRAAVPKKPDPRGLFEIVAELEVPLYRTLFVGDTLVDIQTATNGGVDSVAVSWGFREIAELAKEKPTHIAYSAEQIREIVLGR